VPSALRFALDPGERGSVEREESAMTDAIEELKVRAEILHHRVKARDSRALVRLKAMPELRRAAEPELRALAGVIRRRHCLAVVATEAGFPSWTAARNAITGVDAGADFGTLLCPSRCGGFLNLWYARYEDAAMSRRGTHGYLIAYRRQFLVVGREYISTLGLDPDDRDWGRLGYDWVRPADVGARSRLYAKLLANSVRTEYER
jgi:hypothetical protein